MGLLLAFTAALLALLAVAWVTGAGTASALPHEAHAPMLRGVDEGSLGAPAWAGYAAGLLVIAMMAVTFQIGVRGRWIRYAAAAWSLWYMGAYIALMRAYGAYESGATQIAAGFTVPTAWLVYAIGLSPWALLLLLTYAFAGVYFGPEEQARLDAIIAESRRTLIVRAGEEAAGAPDEAGAPGEAAAGAPGEAASHPDDATPGERDAPPDDPVDG